MCFTGRLSEQSEEVKRILKTVQCPAKWDEEEEEEEEKTHKSQSGKLDGYVHDCHQ